MREFRQQFATNAACLEYLVRCRWPDGFVCPKCSGTSAWLNSKRYVFECRACGRQTSPIAGTIMHRSHIPVQEWFWAAYILATHTPGISALQLQRQLPRDVASSASTSPEYDQRGTYASVRVNRGGRNAYRWTRERQEWQGCCGCQAQDPGGWRG